MRVAVLENEKKMKGGIGSLLKHVFICLLNFMIIKDLKTYRAFWRCHKRVFSILPCMWPPLSFCSLVYFWLKTGGVGAPTVLYCKIKGWVQVTKSQNNFFLFACHSDDVTSRFILDRVTCPVVRRFIGRVRRVLMTHPMRQ